MIVEHAIYPYGYATKVQNGLIVGHYCTRLCNVRYKTCRCGEYVQYLDNYSPMCQNGVCRKEPCNKCGCHDCGFNCSRNYKEINITKIITPIFEELFSHFKDKIKGNKEQMSRQICDLIKTNFDSIPHETKLKLISSLINLMK